MTLFRGDSLSDTECPMCAHRIVNRWFRSAAGWLVALASMGLWVIDHRIVSSALFWLSEAWPGCP